MSRVVDMQSGAIFEQFHSELSKEKSLAINAFVYLTLDHLIRLSQSANSW